jgi:hypothetical protein
MSGDLISPRGSGPIHASPRTCSGIVRPEDTARQMQPFEDRQDAGRRLAAALKCYRVDRPVMLVLPLGGVPVGF